MNPMTQAALGAIVRWGLTLLAGRYLTTMSGDDVATIAAKLVGGIVLAWSLYQKYRARQVLVTSLADGPMTEQQAKAMVADPTVLTPSVTSPTNTVPMPPRAPTAA